jgi:superfamily II DNA or RNA helicase
MKKRFSEEQIVAILRADRTNDDPIWCDVYHSQLNDKRRDEVLKQLRNIGASALLACKSLDEGLDVPSVDVGVV